MKEKQALYTKAMALLEDVNSVLADDPQLVTINIRMAGVVKDLNDILIRAITGIKAEDVK